MVDKQGQTARDPDGDVTTLGLSDEGRESLRRLKEDDYFGEMMDAYKFAIGLALAHGCIADHVVGSKTMFNVGSLDKDRSLHLAVQTLRDERDANEPVYRTAERLAEWGVRELARRAQEGTLSFVALFEEVSAKLNASLEEE